MTSCACTRGESNTGRESEFGTSSEMERFLSFKGESLKAVELPARPYCCVLCDQLCALPTLSCNEKRDLGAEWTMYRQSHVEVSWILRIVGQGTQKYRLTHTWCVRISEKVVTVLGMVQDCGVV